MTKRIVALIAALALILSLCACGQSSKGQTDEEQTTWQEQYDVGVRYLSEGNYEEAIIAFTTAIEIDPKQALAYLGRGNAYIGSGETEENLAAALADYESAVEMDETNVDAYLGLADVYIRQADYDKALELLQQGLIKVGNDEQLTAKISEIEMYERQDETSGQILDESGRVVRNNYFNPDGTLDYYSLIQYNDVGKNDRQDHYQADGTYIGYTLYHESENGLEYYSEDFSPDGVSQSRSIRVIDENQKWVYSASLDENGTEKVRSIAQYDDTGRNIGWDTYQDGILISYARYEGKKTVYYNADGTVTQFLE